MTREEAYIRYLNRVNRGIKKKLAMFKIIAVKLYKDMFYADGKVRVCRCCRIGPYVMVSYARHWHETDWFSNIITK